MVGVPPAAFLARWVVIRELVVPSSGAKCLNFATGDASGQTLPIWDAEALLRGYLREMDSKGRLTRLPPPPDSEPPPGGIPF